jgi:hypothetical protein
MATYNSFKKIASDSIINSAVTGTTLSTNSITTDKINSGAVRTQDIQNLAVGTNQLAASLDISEKTVTYRPIVNTDISSTAAISGSKFASGAVVGNLGFTPLNKAGDTVSGQLTLPSGSAATPSLRATGATGTGIYFPADGQISIATGGTERIRFDTAGRPTNSNQPAFYAAGNGGWYYHNSFPSTASPGGQWRELINGWTWSVQQQGGTNMASNGRFTAPVAGYYYFYAQTYHYNDANNSNGYSHFNIGRNSSIYAGNTGRAPHTIYAHGVPSHHAPGIMASITMYLNQGDYASICPYMAPVARFHGDHSMFAGYLIG